MTRSDIEKLFYDALRGHGVKIYLSDNLPYTEIDEERIVIIVGRTVPATYWKNTTVKVNWCVPDIDNEADKVRIEQIEERLASIDKDNGETDGRAWRYRRTSSDTLSDRNMRCHYVNITFNLQTLNTL